MTRVLLLASALALATGCSTSTFDSPWGQSSDVQGRMSGQEMPEVGTFESEVTHGYIDSYGDWTSFQLDATGEHGWVMVFADIDTTESNVIEDAPIVGCTGPQEGWADFDEPAIHSTITVQELEIDGELVTHLQIEAEFEGAGTVTAVATAPQAL